MGEMEVGSLSLRNTDRDIKILDCTLRDGGYYTDWDFDQGLVEEYAHVIQNLSIDIIEVGYRAEPVADRYFGEYYYLPKTTINRLHDYFNGKVDLALMINAKECLPDNVLTLLHGCEESVSLIRFAVTPDRIQHGIDLAREVKQAGYQTSLNLMYMHKLVTDQTPLHLLEHARGCVDYVYFVDSYGSCLPQQVKEVIKEAKERLPQKIGFHGHDNIDMAFANTLAAIEGGADIVDCTMLGMGRGSGNLRTELLAVFLAKQAGLNLDFSKLCVLLEKFERMKEKYKWGSSLPYAIAGLECLPQKEVMDWIGKRRYSTGVIVRILQANRLNSENTDNGYPSIMDKKQVLMWGTDAVVIIGGGDSVADHADAIVEFTKLHRALIIHSSLKNVEYFIDENVGQLVCLAGQEAEKKRNADCLLDNISMFVVPEKPRIKQKIEKIWLERTVKVAPLTVLGDMHSDENMADISPLNLSLGVVHALGVNKVFLAGFDGYAEGKQEMILAREVQSCIDVFRETCQETDIESITPTLYKIPQSSVYSYL